MAHFDARTGGDWVFSLAHRPARSARPHDLDVFLYGAATCTQSIAGALDFPPGAHVFHGPGRFRGWASSPHGIASVDVWFNNRRVRHRARMTPLAQERCPGPPAVAFELTFPSRPGKVWTETDVLVEVTDGRGGKAELEDRWISWK